jgi:DNA topoisomerase IB
VALARGFPHAVAGDLANVGDCAVPLRARLDYVDEDGSRLADPDAIGRIAELAIPPAWRDVWICPYPMGHLQATGVDPAGRKQYRYHDLWRVRRDQQKCDLWRLLVLA